MSRRSIRCLAVFFFVLAGALPVAAQYQGQVNVGAVVAPVTVRDDTGRIVTDLPMKRFHLYVDGIEVPIRDFALESDLPLSLGFILDTSGSMAGRKMAACTDLISAFLAEPGRVPD